MWRRPVLVLTLILGLSCVGASTSFAQLPKIVVLGDSISAAFGIDTAQGWVNLLAKRLQSEKYGHLVVNASVGGETTVGGVARLPDILLSEQPDVLILELGGNDGLRGFPVDLVETNLAAMVEMATAAGVKVLIIGMVLPPNYGRRYTAAYEAVFRRVAQKFDSALLPFLLQGAATPQSLIQHDGIHPRSEAQPLILEDVWTLLKPLIDEAPGS
jgi:acyl-CoA thioesterase-1